MKALSKIFRGKFRQALGKTYCCPANNAITYRKLQQEILDQVLTILKSSEHVLGCIFAGSYARGEHDAFSDLDMACYLFENGVRLDLDFCKPSEITNPSEVYTDTIIAYDPDGTLPQYLPKANTHPLAEHPMWFEPGDPAMTDWFFWMFRQVVCWAKRGAQNDYRSYDKLTNAISSLAEIRTRLVEMRLWRLDIKDYLTRADADLALRIAKTYPHFQPGEIIQCAKLLLAEYEYVCPAYYQKTKRPPEMEGAFRLCGIIV